MEGEKKGGCPVTGAARAYAWAAGKIDLLQPVFLLLCRVYIGYQAAIAGWGHLHNVDKTADYFATLNIPHPRLNVYIAGCTELIGGILLAVGFLSRLVAIPFSFNFVIAILAVDLSEPKTRKLLENLWNNQDIVLKDDAFPFLFVGIMILIFGPGLLSVDGLLKRLLCRKKPAAPPAPVPM